MTCWKGGDCEACQRCGYCVFSEPHVEKCSEDEPLADWEKELMAGAIPGLGEAISQIHMMMENRHQKYGPGNIAKHGPVGILVRMDDKFARLEAGQGNFDDETVENTLDDIIGYALIWKLWLRKQWPGSELASE